MGNQLGEALQASKKRKSELICKSCHNGDFSMKLPNNKGGYWVHSKKQKEENYIPDFNTTKASIRIGAAFLAFVAFNLSTNDAQITSSIKNFHRVIATPYESIELSSKYLKI